MLCLWTESFGEGVRADEEPVSSELTRGKAVDGGSQTWSSP